MSEQRTSVICDVCGTPMTEIRSGTFEHTGDCTSNRPSNERLSFALARALLALGDEPNDPCQRIQFKGGSYPDNETSGGGMCETALVSFFRQCLDAARPADETTGEHG